MSTQLELVSITQADIDSNLEPMGCKQLLLPQEFLFQVIVNRDILNKCLTEEEQYVIRPNWGEIDLQSTDVLKGEKREQYLELLLEVMRTNSAKNLDAFLYENRITSIQLRDRVRSSQQVALILKKLEGYVSDPSRLGIKYQSEFQQLYQFLNERMERNEFVLIEFMD